MQPTDDQNTKNNVNSSDATAQTRSNKRDSKEIITPPNKKKSKPSSKTRRRLKDAPTSL